MKKIRELRITLGLSQEKLAEAADLSVGYISAIENDKKKPSFKRLEKIASVLGVSAKDLMDGSERVRQSCPFLDPCGGLDIDKLDGVTKEIFQTVMSLPLEEQIKVLSYACDLKRLVDFSKSQKRS